MLEYYRRRAASYERIYARPERQADLRELELACGTGWWTPHGARDASREQVFAMLAGPSLKAQTLDPQWTDHGHYWVLRYTQR